jgi:hypothetical protein
LISHTSIALPISSREFVVIAKCATPPCHGEFRELSKGKIFLLPPSYDLPDVRRVERLIDHCYWLCPDCVRAYTIELEGTTAVVRKLKREPAAVNESTLRLDTRPPKLEFPGFQLIAIALSAAIQSESWLL